MSEWAIVELMGHRRRAGRVDEVDRFGAKLLRVDIPCRNAGPDACETFVSEYYGGSAIYAFRPCAEDVARAAAAAIGDPRPVLPATFRLAQESGDEHDADADADADDADERDPWRHA